MWQTTFEIDRLDDNDFLCLCKRTIFILSPRPNLFPSSRFVQCCNPTYHFPVTTVQLIAIQEAGDSKLPSEGLKEDGQMYTGKKGKG